MDRPPPPPLPVDAIVADLVAALRTTNAVVLRAPPGAGKTTRVPPALLDAGGLVDGKLIVLEPRRIAARAAARRIADERGAPLGQEIGYRVRFDSRVSRATRLEVVTEGILLRQLHDDPLLEAVGAVVFDEFHERRLDSDLLLAMLRRLQRTVRPELRIVVMSATLATEPIAEFLRPCPVVESAGRLFPVEVEYRGGFERRRMGEAAAQGVAHALERTAGDLLVFLPGVGEIRQAAQCLGELAAQRGLVLAPLYGDLPAEQQDAAILPDRAGRRKVVLSTNVAETSLTIEGVTGVVDTGLARVMRFDPHVGLDRLELEPISRASADQRAGRAGRLAPGYCLRLWDEATHRARPAADEPEIRRVDLARPFLSLLAFGESEPQSFPWFEAPRTEALEQAASLLARLGAIAHGQLTPLGQVLARLPAPPRLARLAIEAARWRALERGALAAALLSERDPFERAAHRRDDRGTSAHASESDLVDALAALEEFDEQPSRGAALGLDSMAARAVLKARDELVKQLRGEAVEEVVVTPAISADADTAMQRCLLAAFPDRLARRRESGSRRAVMVGGRGVVLDARSAVRGAELFLCLDIDGAGSEALVRKASAVEREWLVGDLLRTVVETEFDVASERVQARRRVYWDSLLLEESPAPLGDAAEAARVLAEAAALRLERVLPPPESDAAGFLVRARALRAWMPELGLPPLDDEALRALLPSLAHGKRSFEDLRRGPWLECLRGLFDYRQLQAIDREAPERIAVPSGSRIALAYEPGKPPVLAVRIQEMFGLADTPRVAGGRVPVLLHLLAPNMRPQQVTDDLRSFWENTYPVVRRDLRGRYPKHAWPEDPWNAPAMRGAKRRPQGD